MGQMHVPHSAALFLAGGW